MSEKRDEEEEISIDFSKVGSFFKSKKREKAENDVKKKPKKKHKEEAKEEPREETKDKEDISIDFGKVTGFFKKGKKEEIVEKKDEEEVSFDIRDLKKGLAFLDKYKVVFLIMIPIILSVYFRMYPAYLPITDDWATNSVNNYYKNQILAQVNQQYPNLPDANKDALVNEEFNKLLKEQGDLMNQQIEQTSQQFKEQFKDEQGHTYLGSIDPYYYQRHIENYLERGQAGTIYTNEIEDPSPQELMWLGYDFSKKLDWDGERMAPIGAPTEMSLHTYFGVFFHKIYLIFNPGQSVMASMFFLTVIVSGLAVIPAFFIGKKLAGNVGGFFTSTMLAINANFLARTMGGSPDTDPYPVFFPLMVVWCFIESITQKSIKKRVLFASLAGLFVGLFGFSWQGWWFIFDIIMAGVGIYIFLLIIIQTYQKKSIFMLFREKEFRNYALSILTFVITSAIFISILIGPSKVLSPLTEPFSFIAFKKVAVTSLWPTVTTTVAELNPASFANVVASLGGNVFFLLAIFGIILNFVIKRGERERIANIKIGILLALWFVSTIYASTKGVRFIMLMVPAFSIAFGVSIGIIYKKVSEWVSKSLGIDSIISTITIVLLLLLLLIQPIRAAENTARNDIPLMNDGWYNTATMIKTNTSEDSIINTWWDYGHWLITLGDRRTTFDGGGQDEHMAYWIGKSLLVDDERKTVAILRMVDCGNNDAFWALDKELNDTVKGIDILNDIILLDKEDARRELLKYVSKETAEEVLKYSHCTPPDDYYITSDDMVGKSGVWAHFGSWDFKRAAMYQSVKKLGSADGTNLLKTKFNLDDETASQYYYEIQNTDADQWIASWPSYVSGIGSCQEEGNEIICTNNIGGQALQFKINLTTMETVVPTTQKEIHPASIVYTTANSIVEKKFEDVVVPYSIALIPDDGNFINIIMMPELASSTFTKLFFFKGHSQKCFDLFYYERQVTGGDIYTWKVNWDCIK